MSEVDRTLAYALENYPDQVETVEVRELVLDSARQNDRRPAYLKIAVPDDVVKGLRSRGDEGDLVLLVRVPRQVRKRQESRIILPGQNA